MDSFFNRSVDSMLAGHRVSVLRVFSAVTASDCAVGDPYLAAVLVDESNGSEIGVYEGGTVCFGVCRLTRCQIRGMISEARACRRA